MENAKKTFISGLNLDDSRFSLKQEDHRDALNVRVVTSSEGKAGSLSNINGTRQIGGYNSNKQCKVVGTYEDPTSNDVFYFVVEDIDQDNTTSCIYVLKSEYEYIYKVLSDADMTTDYPLNFSKDKPITGISFIDGILYFTGVPDREPFRINVDRGIKIHSSTYVSEEDAYITPIPKKAVTLIRKPPMIPLKITALQDSNRDTSFLRSRGHTFAYRYVYKDGETSVFSPTSHHYPHQDMEDLDHKTTRKIRVDFPMHEAESYGVCQDVAKVQFAVKFDNDTSYFIWKEFDHVKNATQFANQNTNTEGAITAFFFNDVLGFAVDDSNSVKLNDTVPLEAQALSIAQNRLFLGNIVEGRLNKRAITNNDLSLSLDRRFFVDTFTAEQRNRGGVVGFSHASAYQIGIVFYDFAGRSGGVLTDDSLKVITPERTAAMDKYNAAIDFTINSAADSLIPDWAEYYSIVRTKNLIKDFTISNLSDKVRYFREASTGAFSVNIEKNFPSNNTTEQQGIAGSPNGTFSDEEFEVFSQDHKGIAIGLGDLTSYKQGYSYQEGDRVKLITPNNVFEAALTGQQGRYVTTNLIDINTGDFLNVSTLAEADFTTVYEIFSPHKIQPNEFYYEAFMGRIIDGASAGTKTYSNKTGSLIGDVYVKDLVADTSDFENFYWSTSGSSETENNNQLTNDCKYIDFPIFYGVGINDLTANTGRDNNTNTKDLRFDIKIDSVSGSADTFKFRKRLNTQMGQDTSYGSSITITGAFQTLSDGVQIKFENTTGHEVDDRWVVNAKGNQQVQNTNGHGLAIYKDLPGSIIQGSKVIVKYNEYKNETLINSGYNFNWQKEVFPTGPINYANLEELCWETNFGLQIFQAHGNFNKVSFRRGTMGTTGGGATKIFVLDSQDGIGGEDGQTVSQSDGTGIAMIIKTRESQNGDNAGRNIKINQSHWKVEFADEFPYKTEQMSPSDDYFLRWMQITGRPNLVVKEVSSQKKVTGIAFSETKPAGSKINGLSKFSALDEKLLDDATGPLRKLSLTTKAQSTGTVLLGVSENETTAIYIGESQLQQTSSGGQFLAVSSGVIGTLNTLQGSYGTLHPESFVVNEGSAYWYDVKNHTVVKYENQGLVPIGDNKMKTFFDAKSKVIQNDTIRRFVVGTFDDFNREYILSLPSTGETTVTLQEDPFYPDTPHTVYENPDTGPVTAVVYVVAGKPWHINEQMPVIDGCGEITLDIDYPFLFGSPPVIGNNNITVTVLNDSGNTGGSNPVYSTGTITIKICGIPEGTNTVELNMVHASLPGGQDIDAINLMSYAGDDGFEYGYTDSGDTPLRITNAIQHSPLENLEEKEFTANSGVITIPCTSNVPWQLGNSGDNDTTGIIKVDTDGTVENIASSDLTTNATAISTVGYESGSFNIVVSNLDQDVSEVRLESRPLKSPRITLQKTAQSQTSFDVLASVEINGSTITEKGVVHSKTNTNPLVGGTGVTKIINSETVSSSFTEQVSGLQAGDTVYYRGYIVSEFGTTHSPLYQCTTDTVTVQVPVVTTVSYNAANSPNRMAGRIESNTTGITGITERGFLWSSSSAIPTEGATGVNKIQMNQFSISSFPYNYSSGILTNIFPSSSTIYFRAYAKNTSGIGYGAVLSFTTPNTSVGISGFSLATSSVPTNGGNATLDIFKSNPTGVISGTIQYSISSSAYQTIQFGTKSFSFLNTQTTDSVTLSIPANTTNQNRSLQVKITAINNVPNKTNKTLPITVNGAISQGGGGATE